ncbi:mitochondrial chaperone BCS1 [Kalaharituber pfeilii]|nr:mitochondrial chaperone BCS1 [Kalaharituber pfeilii]
MSAHQRGQLQPRTAPNSAPSTWASTLLSRITPGAHHLAVETTYTQLPGGAISTTFSLVPGPGKHLLNYHNTLISVSRVRDPKHLDMRTGSPFETITLTTLYRDRHIFPALLSEAQSLAQKLTEGKTVIYTSWGTEWKQFGSPRRKRPLESVILDTGVKESLVADVKDFLASSEWYYNRGIPYRRGYLLHGPPGSGKSSFINALAGELDYNICLLNLSERGLTDDRLNHLLTNLPDRSIALLEDVDAAFGRARVQTQEDGYRGANVTFSGLLNALDGVASGEERILMLTTNHRDRLDEALVRPGRVDREVYIGWATEAQVNEMWVRFYGDGRKCEQEEFVRLLKEAEVLEGGKKAGKVDGVWGRGISTAQLQGLFVYNKGNPEGAVRLLKGMLPESVEWVGKEVR